ncbi:hypothetical protein D3C87_2103870 [compost metagenome]
MDVVDLNQLDQTGLFAVAFDNETALALVVNMFIVKIRQLDKSLVRLFEPVAHDAGVIVELVDKAQILALQRSEFYC